MTVSNTIAKEVYTCNGSTVSFSFPNPFFVPSDLDVQLLNTATGAFVSPAPALNGSGTYDYTVSGTLDPTILEYLSGGTVTTNNAPPAGYVLMILRSIPETQQAVYNNNTLFPAKTLEASLDRLTMLAQQLTEAAERAMSAPPVDSGISMQLPPAAQRAGQLAGFDPDGNAITYPVAGTFVGNTRDNINDFAYYDVDNTFSPAEITQGFVVAGTANNAGYVEVTVYYPINFPTQVDCQAVSVSFTGNAGWSSGWFFGANDARTYFIVYVYGAEPNTAVVVSGIVKGH